MEQAVLAYITNYLFSKQQEQSLLKIFKQLDTDNDGVLTLDELEVGFMEFFEGTQLIFRDELKKIIAQVDSNNNGTIEYSEFIMCCTNLNNLMTEKNLKEAFNLFDLDQNG